MERLTNRTKEAKSNVTIKEVCDKLADYEDLEELIGIPLEELAKIFRQHIPNDCKHPQKAIVLTDGDVDEWNARKEAREKQMPKKPIDKTKPDDGASLSHINRHIIVCPSCNGRLKLKSKGRYCDKCGQRLDWGMKNEVN